MLWLVALWAFLWCFTNGKTWRRVLLVCQILPLILSTSVHRNWVPFPFPPLNLDDLSIPVSHSLKQVVEGDSLVSISAFECFATLLCSEAHLSQMLDLVIKSNFTRVVLGPLRCFSVKLLQVILEHLRDDCILGIIRFRGAEKRL